MNVVIGRFVPWRISTDYAGWILPENENREGVNIKQWFFYFLLTVRLSIFISVINQLDAQNFCFAISLFHASTCFEHMCSSSGGPNCTTQPLVSSHHLVHRLREVLSQPVHQTATYRSDDTRGRVIQFWPPDDEHMCSKHVDAWHKLIVKQNFCALSWLITEINNMCVSIFSTIFFLNISHYKKNWSRYYHKCTHVFMYRTRFLVRFEWNLNFLDGLTKNP